jgi:phosphonate transport system substrate-binding protein
MRLMIVLLLVAGLSLPFAASHADELAPLEFGVVPQQASAKLARGWIPVTRWLSERLGRPVRFRTAPSIPEFEKRVAAGEYDIAYMNPYHYVVYSKQPGYRAIANQRNKHIRGILVTRKLDGVTSLKELNGQTLAFPAPAAFAASILTRAYLKNEGIDFTPVYVRSHDSVYRAVAEGHNPVGGGVRRTFNAMDPQVTAQLRVLWESDGYTPHALAVHPSVPDALRDEIQRALLELEQSEDGRRILDGITFTGGLQAASDADWNDVRALGIDLLD